MLCYKEVHKYNGRYYSRFDNGYEFKIGEICKAKGDYIYATDTIANVLDYGYVPFDMAILEMEVIGKYHKNGYVITTKQVRVIREVNDYERVNESRADMARNKGNAELFNILKQRKESILSELQDRI